MNLIIKPNALTVEIYNQIRETAGFMAYQDDDIKEALAHSLYTVVIYDDSLPVGIARLIGDNKIAFFIKDVVAIPAYQHKGVGKLLMKSLFDYFDLHAVNNAYIGLMSTPGKEQFYKKYGFIERPSEGLGSGMVLFYESKRK